MYKVKSFNRNLLPFSAKSNCNNKFINKISQSLVGQIFNEEIKNKNQQNHNEKSISAYHQFLIQIELSLVLIFNFFIKY